MEHAINIVVGETACLPKTKRVADKELWDVFENETKKDKTFTFRHAHFVIKKKYLVDYDTVWLVVE